MLASASAAEASWVLEKESKTGKIPCRTFFSELSLQTFFMKVSFLYKAYVFQVTASAQRTCMLHTVVITVLYTSIVNNAMAHQ
jgi:hypothetical protein